MNDHANTKKHELYIAHINEESGRIQTVREHSESTARIARGFATEELKDIVYVGAIAHDIGKLRASFQKRIRGELNEKVEHSICGAKEIFGKFNDLAGLMLAYCIAGHHSGLPDGGNKNDISNMPTLHGRLNREFDDYKGYDGEIEIPDIDAKRFIAWLTEDCDNDVKKLIDKFSFLTRYCFSCITDADTIDTAEFCGTRTEKKLRMDFTESLKKLNERMDAFKCVTELQKTRRVLQEQVYEKVGTLGEIYLTNMPTGSGKTLCSMKFALEKAINEGKKHIIYVIPYNSIIDQTVEEMQKTFGESAEILRHQSSFSYEDDDGYEAYSEDYRDAAKAAVENWDAPLIVTTSVQFFESIFSHKKRKLRKLHNMADSIIIFDEAHLMPRKYLQPCLQAVAYITRYLNSSAVFLTATMPNFSDLLEKYALRDSRTVELIEDKSDFGKFHKCSFKYDGEIGNEKLVSSAMENPSALIIVNRRATAKEIYELCSGEKYHLSTYMAACDRKKKIEDIRAALKRLEKDYPDGKDVPPERRIIIVSTSLIEAGVDIDVHSVYRELTGLDSVLQAGGRCNREGRRSGACTHIFSLDGEKAVVMGDGRENITKGLLEKYDDISDPACIEEYYDRLFFMNEDEITGNTISNDCMKLDSIPFKEYGKNFRIIDANTVSVVIDKDEDSHRMIEELKFAGATDTRRLQKYTCSVKPKELEELMRQHVVEDYDSGIWCLTNMDYYSEETGIKFEGEDYFI